MSILDLSELDIEDVVIGPINKWTTGIGTSVILPIIPGKKYKVVAVTSSAHIAPLSSQFVGENGDVIDYATGYDNRVIVNAGTEYSFVAPEDANALYIRRTSSTDVSMLPVVYSSAEYELQLRTFNSSYNPEDTESVSAKVSALANGKDNIETFLFFSDPHLTDNSRYEIITKFVRDRYISTLQRYYNSCPLDNCICGGDWLNFTHTDDEACAFLGFADGYMRKLFKNYRPLLGNHDTNPYITDGRQSDWDNALPYKTVRNLQFRENGNTYYTFDGIKTKFYMMNSGMSYCKTMTDNTFADFIGPRWEQISWLGTKLIEDDAQNSIIAMHIYANASNETDWFSTQTGYRAKGIHEFGYNCKLMAIAYNNRQSITLNGNTYNFSSCTGRVMFILCGHTHWDYVDTTDEIPIVCTTNLEGGHYDSQNNYVTECVPTFDCCLSDLDNTTFYMTRVGVGASRIIHYSPISCPVNGTISLTPKLPGTLSWSSRSSSIATVSSGTVSGVSAGVVGIISKNEVGDEEYWIVKVS